MGGLPLRGDATDYGAGAGAEGEVMEVPFAGVEVRGDWGRGVDVGEGEEAETLQPPPAPGGGGGAAGTEGEEGLVVGADGEGEAEEGVE